MSEERAAHNLTKLSVVFGGLSSSARSGSVATVEEGGTRFHGCFHPIVNQRDLP
jgi:hypothetical protein